MKAIIERTEKGLVINNPVIVLLNHNPDMVLGFAHCEYNEAGELEADFSGIAGISGLYPSVGYSIVSNEKGVLHCIGLSTLPNVDPTISRL